MKQVMEMVENFAWDKLATKKAFIQKRDALREEVKRELLGKVRYEDFIERELEKLAERNQRKTAAIMQRLNQVEEHERHALRTLEKQVTADDLAELTLLATLDLSERELSYYFKKFENKPLALKKIEEIYKEKYEGDFLCPRSRKEIFEDWDKEVREVLRYINDLIQYPSASAYDMFADEAIMTGYVKRMFEPYALYTETPRKTDKEIERNRDRVLHETLQSLVDYSTLP